MCNCLHDDICAVCLVKRKQTHTKTTTKKKNDHIIMVCVSLSFFQSYNSLQTKKSRFSKLKVFCGSHYCTVHAAPQMITVLQTRSKIV